MFMNSRPLLLAVTFSALGAALLFALTQPEADANQKENEKEEPAAPDLTLEEPVALDNMHHLMEYVFEPSYKRLKESLASEPTDRAAWKDVKGDSLTLAEATNLLFHRLPEDDAAEWLRLAVATREAGNDLYQAARKSDYSAARGAYQGMLKRCNTCHDQFADGEHQLEP